MNGAPTDLRSALARLHAPAQSDDILSLFVEHAEAKGLTLYPAQEEAILELLSGKHVFLSTPTGSGKSLVAAALHFQAMAEGKTSVYTCPVKALVNEKFFALCRDFGPENVGMMTGDASINRNAPILCCTAEILSNLALRGQAGHIQYVVMDEFHYYDDKERGTAWQIPLLAMESTTFLLMSATLGDVSAIASSLKEVTGRDVAEIRSSIRPVPLDFEYQETPLHETLDKLIAAGKYPIYLVNFTQRAAAEQAQNLMSVNFCSKEEKEAIRAALFEARFDTPYGKEFERFLRHGVGVHHAGLLPKYRRWVERLSQAGLLKVISGTDTLGVGVNIPIRTVAFTQLCKFDGEKTSILTVRDFLQISGRAGRKGFDDRGTVVVQAPEHVIENLRLAQKGAAGKKVVKRQPPAKGYVHWDKQTFDRLLSRPPEPLQSRFVVNHGMLLDLLGAEVPERGGGYGRLVKLIRRSHQRDHGKRGLLKTAARGFRTLWHAQLISVEKGRPAKVSVSSELQRDFSLLHTLSLYLLFALQKLDPQSENYALDVITLTESILENPDVVLYAQLNQLKADKVAEMKAQGVEYEQRMEELEKLEWPKPHRDFIYATFNDFADKHPWVGQENIRPKSIARDMLERFLSFHDYIREYGLARSEGVLLRYLSDVYKALSQNVPETYLNEELEGFIAQLRLLLKQVDSSLLDEWEALSNPQEWVTLPGEKLSAAPKKWWEDDKQVVARARASAHALLKALGEKRYEDARLMVRPGDVEWTAEKLEAEMAPYWAEYSAVVLTPVARRPHNTVFRTEGPKRWKVQQKVMDPEANGEWMLDCILDLSQPPEEDAPLLELRRIGT